MQALCSREEDCYEKVTDGDAVDNSDGRLLIATGQAEGKASTQAARISYRTRRSSEAIHRGSRLGEGRAAVSPGIGTDHGVQWARRQVGGVAWQFRFGAETQSEALCLVWHRSRGWLTRCVPGVEDTYSPTNSSTTIFDIQFLKIDSDQAVEVAQKHGGDKLLEKSPDTPIFYQLDWNHPNNNLVWHIVYGASRNEPKLIVEVDATTGLFIRAQK